MANECKKDLDKAMMYRKKHLSYHDRNFPAVTRLDMKKVNIKSKR